MSTTEKLERFLDEVARLTEHGNLIWQDSVDEETFQVSFRHGTLKIRRQSGHALCGCDSDVREIVLVDREGSTIAEAQSAEPRLVELFNLARRSARKTDQVLDELLQELQAQG